MLKNLEDRENRAFALIEVLVVVLIVGILTALLFPVYENMMNSARQAGSVSNIHNVGQGLLGWIADENRGMFPYAFIDHDQGKYPSGTDANSLPSNYAYWAGAVFSSGHVDKVDMFFSPLQKKYWRDPAFYKALKSSGSVWQWAMIGYGASGLLMPYSTDAQGRPTTSLASVKRPSSTILLAEAAANPTQSDGDKYDGFHAVCPNRMTYPMAVRTPGKVLACFVDGHVETLKPDDAGWSELDSKWKGGLDTKNAPWRSVQ